MRKVPRYVPNDLPVLPASVRLLHDAADVSVATLAATVAENYAGCREDGERLAGLQRVVDGVLGR